MTGIGDNRQVRKMLGDGDGVDVKGVARVFFECANAALAQHHPRIAMTENVLSAHEPLFDEAAHASLEQDGMLRAADGVQQSVVLHVARADL